MTELGTAGGYQRLNSIAELRLRVTLNHFKRMLLGAEHQPGLAQGRIVFDKLRTLSPRFASKDYVDSPDAPLEARVGMTVTQRTWESWFDVKQPRPKSSPIASLDRVAEQCFSWTRPRDGIAYRLPLNFYADLFKGGLLSTMLSDVEPLMRRTQPVAVCAKKLREHLMLSAAGYSPKSAWHLHLDALEVLNFSAAVGPLDRDEVIRIAGERIYDILYDLWGNTEHPAILNTVYAHFHSEDQERWDSKPEAEKQEDLKDPLLWMDDPALVLSGRLSRMPSFSLLGDAADITPGRIYRLLFAIGTDSEFLQGDALTAWALDLATAGVAGVALFYAGSPYLKPHKEQLVLNAIDSLMVCLQVNGVAVESHANLWGGEVEELLRIAMLETGARWSRAVFLGCFLVGSSRVDLQACKLEYSIVSPK